MTKNEPERIPKMRNRLPLNKRPRDAKGRLLPMDPNKWPSPEVDPDFDIRVETHARKRSAALAEARMKLYKAGGKQSKNLDAMRKYRVMEKYQRWHENLMDIVGDLPASKADWANLWFQGALIMGPTFYVPVENRLADGHKPHDVDTDKCWCRPALVRDSELGGTIYVHFRTTDISYRDIRQVVKRQALKEYSLGSLELNPRARRVV